MGEQLAAQTGGELGIKVYPNGALGNERDTIEQLKIGGLDMMRINVAPLNNVVPETIVPALPFLFRSEEHMHAVLDGPVGDQILAAMEAQGMVGLAFYDSGARSIYAATKPVKTLADVSGMKIRVQQSDLFVAMVEALGANPTPMPYGEVYTALKTGIVDAAENNFPSYESSRHFEAAKYYTMTEHSMAPEVLVFSKVIWDTLEPEDQEMIRKAAKESVPHMRKLWDEREAKAQGDRRRRRRGDHPARGPAGLGGRDAASLREVRRHAGAAGAGAEGPGHTVRPPPAGAAPAAAPARHRDHERLERTGEDSMSAESSLNPHVEDIVNEQFAAAPKMTGPLTRFNATVARYGMYFSVLACW